MTAAKLLQRKEVDKVKATLAEALAQELPAYARFLDTAAALPEPPTKRGKALMEAYLGAWAASARFDRRERKAAARKQGSGVAFFDDDQVDLAIAKLERARAFVRNAREAIELDMERITKECARQGLAEDFGMHPANIRAIERLEKAIGFRAAKLQTVQGIPQARNRQEWDAFLSETAKNLLAVGLGTREVAGLLTGAKPEAVSRATLERFRQRVNRLNSRP